MRLEEVRGLRLCKCIRPHNLCANMIQGNNAGLDEMASEVKLGIEVLVALGFDGIVGKLNRTGIVAFEKDGRRSISQWCDAMAKGGGNG